MGYPLSGLDLIPQAVWVTDTHGRVRWVNRASVALFGSRRATHFSVFIAPENLNGTRASFARNVLEAVDTTVLNTVLVGLFGRFAAESTSVLLRRTESSSVSCSSSGRSQSSVSRSGPARLPRPNLTPRQYEGPRAPRGGSPDRADRSAAPGRREHRAQPHPPAVAGDRRAFAARRCCDCVPQRLALS